MNNYGIQLSVFILTVASFIFLIYLFISNAIPREISGIAIIAIVFTEVFCYFQYRKEKTFKNYISKGFDYRLIGVCLIYTYVIVFVLIGMGYLTFTDSSPPDSSSPDLFWQARIEFFMTFGISLAILGAIYSLFSKQRADDVFDISEDIYKAITSFITSYDQLLDGDTENFRSIPNVIRKSKKNLTLFLGSPAVGYFRDPKAGKKFVRSLEDKLSAEEKNTDFKVQLLCWSHKHSAQYTAVGAGENELQKEFNNLYDTLIMEMSKPKPNTLRSLYNWTNNFDPGYRFIISDGKEIIYWVLVDTSSEQAKEEREGKRIKVGGFYSDRSEMVDLFQGIFDKTTDSASNKVELIDLNSNQRKYNETQTGEGKVDSINLTS